MVMFCYSYTKIVIITAFVDIVLLCLAKYVCSMFAYVVKK